MQYPIPDIQAFAGLIYIQNHMLKNQDVDKYLLHFNTKWTGWHSVNPDGQQSLALPSNLQHQLSQCFWAYRCIGRTQCGSLVWMQSTTSHRASTSTCRHFVLWLCCHSHTTRAPIANLSNSAQLEGIPYHSFKLHPGPCSSVGMQRGTYRHTDRHTNGCDHYTFRVIYDSHKM